MPPQPPVPQAVTTPQYPSAQRDAQEMTGWIGGCNSLLHPTTIAPNQYAWGENILTRGGIPQTRPGMQYLGSISGSLLQGMTIFEPNGSLPLMVVAVDGIIYSALPPYTSFKQIPGIQFSANAPIVNFCAALQSVQNNLDGSLTIVSPPRKLLMIQDGITQCAYWDGAKAVHLNPNKPLSQTPIGLWMAWANSRLWVAHGSSVYASDIANPLSFTENTYLAETSNFQLPGDCTGLVQTVDLMGLLAFTATTTTAFQSSIRTRSQWQTTPNFQSLIIPDVGCVAGRSIVAQYGLIYWLSQRGLINLNSAAASKLTSHLPTMDGEMMRSKRRLSGDASRACAITFENLLLLSVPSGDSGNAHTWVLDQAPSGNNESTIERNIMTGGELSAAWTGVWTGFRPVAWAVTIDGSACYCATQDINTSVGNTPIHVWKAFDRSRTDYQGSPISCQFETGMLSYPTKRRFAYAELDLAEIMGNVGIQVYFGCTKGPWIKVLDTTLEAEEGCFGSSLMPIVTKTSVIEAYQPQVRTIRTDDFSPASLPANVESTDLPGVDKSCAILVQWQGRMAVRRIIINTTQESQSQVGLVATSEAGQVKAIASDGTAITAQ